MTLSFKTILLGTTLSAALAAPVAALAETRTLDGTVTYRERMALPPDAEITVQLVDVSLADAPATLLGETTLTPSHEVPVPYQITYDDADLTEGHSYAVQARITVEGQLIFINTSRHAVFGPEPDATDIVVERVAASPEAAAPSPAGRWLAEDIGGGGVIDNAQSVLELAADGTVTGSGGCNRMTGTAVIEGDALSFGPIASTRMGCVPALGNQETKFFAALAATRNWQIDELGKLILLDAEGKALMRLAPQ
ncbi:YbaY family lipoprotein [Paracoccus zhejiangensis]|uniref:DUF306 domain-containing protein n=1 Tax=Paracoccus zhejiangensis TaxID=1077935 RepID=A0A2H5F4U8_9RHOB|nr:YbaY family lipoprotein [Paracoccus zhejiangensis]AUH66571.1 hypothetical protein CX676_19890 [Paracoccus zhejiangensis]